MNKIYLAILLSSWALYGHAQPKAILAKPLQDSIKKDRIANIYANRKYSFSLSESLYGSLSHYHPFGVFDITFSDRLTWLDSLLKNASLEVNAGIGFEPFQGTKVHLGADYELLSDKIKFNLYMGCQYTLGLAQGTTMTDNSIVNLGFHNYLVPFVGFVYWPGKKDVLDTDSVSTELYRNPKFWQLFYFKIQVGYSFLISNLQVDTANGFDKNLYQIIKRNTANTLLVKIGVGINIPSGNRKPAYHIMAERIRKLLDSQ